MGLIFHFKIIKAKNQKNIKVDIKVLQIFLKNKIKLFTIIFNDFAITPNVRLKIIVILENVKIQFKIKKFPVEFKESQLHGS